MPRRLFLSNQNVQDFQITKTDVRHFECSKLLNVRDANVHSSDLPTFGSRIFERFNLQWSEVRIFKFRIRTLPDLTTYTKPNAIEEPVGLSWVGSLSASPETRLPQAQPPQIKGGSAGNLARARVSCKINVCTPPRICCHMIPFNPTATCRGYPQRSFTDKPNNMYSTSKAYELPSLFYSS